MAHVEDRCQIGRRQRTTTKPPMSDSLSHKRIAPIWVESRLPVKTSVISAKSERTLVPPGPRSRFGGPPSLVLEACLNQLSFYIAKSNIMLLVYIPHLPMLAFLKHDQKRSSSP